MHRPPRLKLLSKAGYRSTTATGLPFCELCQCVIPGRGRRLMHDHELSDEHLRNYEWLKVEWRDYRFFLQPRFLLEKVTSIREHHDRTKLFLKKCLAVTSHAPRITEFKASLLTYVLSDPSPNKEAPINKALREIKASEAAALLMMAIMSLRIRGQRGKAVEFCRRESRREFAAMYGHLLISLILPFLLNARMRLKHR